MWRDLRLALLALFGLSLTLGAGASSLTQQVLLKQVPDDEVQWLQTDDGQFLALLRDAVVPPSRGVLVLVPDPAQHPDQQPLLHHLRRQMNHHGWVTLALMPPGDSDLPPAASSAVSTAETAGRDPTAPPGAQAAPPPPLTPLAMAWQQRLRAAAELTRVYKGLFVVYAEGRSAAALAQLYQRQALETPQALIVRAPFEVEQQRNRQLATTLAGVPLPVLDLFSRYDNRFALATREQRLYQARAAAHPNYRQRELFGTESQANHAERLAQELHSYLAFHYDSWQAQRQRQRQGY